MAPQEQTNYDRIEVAIDYIKLNFKAGPSLEEIAQVVGISPFHFQRMFTEWAGVSPKKFVQYLSVEYAKDLLKDRPFSLLDVAYETGLSGTGRLHDLFVKIEAMTPGEYKSGGKSLQISYSFANSPFGKLIVASTEKGVCHMAFDEHEHNAVRQVKSRFPDADFHHGSDKHQQGALSIFQQDWRQLDQVKLHLHGTEFQLKVWDALLKVPLGGLSTYGSIANVIDRPAAARAVGTAIGKNPVAFLIPCHRVIQGNGKPGGYMWGETRKSAIIGWEGARLDGR